MSVRIAVMALCVATPALAHIELDEPLVRHGNGDNGDNAVGEINKSGPCGLGGAAEVRDSSRVTTYPPGATLTVKWRETIGHTGRMRIAFAADGNLQADFDANVLVELPDPAGGSGNIGDGNQWEADLTLPTAPCDNCTLQVIQAMNGNTTAPVGTPSPGNTYFQCADLALVEGAPNPPPVQGEGAGEPMGCTSTHRGAGLPGLALVCVLILFSRACRRRAR
jgi:hypothetical protein